MQRIADLPPLADEGSVNLRGGAHLSLSRQVICEHLRLCGIFIVFFPVFSDGTQMYTEGMISLIYTDLTKKALKISFAAHKNQVDIGGIPYVYHPYHLAEQMDDEYSVCVALLHDVVEDSGVTLEKLEACGFPDDVVDAIDLLTHNSRMPYMDYIKMIKRNALARKVKLADLKHNSDLSRIDHFNEHTFERIAKYNKALKYLTDEFSDDYNEFEDE